MSGKESPARRVHRGLAVAALLLALFAALAGEPAPGRSGGTVESAARPVSDPAAPDTAPRRLDGRRGCAW